MCEQRKQHERRPPSAIYLFLFFCFFVFYVRLRAVFVFAGFQLANISMQLGLYCYMLLFFLANAEMSLEVKADLCF